MKKINFLKGMLVVAILFIANLTVFAGNPGDNLIYNAEDHSPHNRRLFSVPQCWSHT